MNYFNTRHLFFISPYGIYEEEREKFDKFLQLLDRSNVMELFEKRSKEKGGRPNYSQANLLAAILYCFAFSKGSLRDIEDNIKFDLRVMYLMDNECPTHMTISNFINKEIEPKMLEIFTRITNEIIKEMDIDTSTLFVDGTKIEANANKYKFVWKPITYHNKLTIKIKKLLDKYGLANDIYDDKMITSDKVSSKITSLSKIAKEKKELDDLAILSKHLIKVLEYEEKERICGPNRKSYFKTDHDATAMCLKEDYYSGLGSNMHAGYNVQIGVSQGLILSYLVSQSRNDFKDYIPLMNRYYQQYDKYPVKVGADAGYGSEENYVYNQENNITSYIKHSSWEGNVTGTNPTLYKVNDDDTITCLNGNIGHIDTDITRHNKKKNTTFFKVTGCKDCEFRLFCKRYHKKKSDNYRIFEVNIRYRRLIQEAESNLLSPEGIAIRVNRSCQVEGVYGIIKQDEGYDRFRRRGIDKVELEFMLECLGFNIRKLFNYYSGKAKLGYWKPPETLQAEEFKKPSAKKLSKKAQRKKLKSANQKAKDDYKNKKKKSC